MLRKISILISFLSLLLQGITCFSQQQADYIPKVIPPSPNAASLMKFSDIPVSTYTGTADVTIPIYTISGKDINVPISLSYHTGGIRQKEEAGWVGLGWVLNAGGAISRSIMDQDDLNGNYFNAPVPEITSTLQYHSPLTGGVDLGAYAYDLFCDYLVYTDGGAKNFSTTLGSNNNPLHDMEPDIYSYNFLGHSGKFILDRSKKAILQKQENIKIEILSDANGWYFKITDETGNQFFFRSKEYTVSSANTFQPISSWYLTQVISQKNETINFNYVTDNTWTSVAGEKSQTYRVGCSQTGLTTVESAFNTYLNITLQSIDFDNGQIQFSFDNNRTDLNNGKKLNAVKIYSKDASSNLKYLWEYQFTYSYFNATSSTPYEYQRLKLDNVKQVSGSIALSPYVFTYIEPATTLTAKHSYSVDHWGYCNGQYNSTYLIPSYHGVYNATVPGGYYQTYLSFDGANRTPNGTYMQSFALQQVQYPTGGKTVFEYEPNDYDEQNSFNGRVDFEETNTVPKSIQIVVPTRGTTSGTIDLTNLFPLIDYAAVGNNLTVQITFRESNNNCTKITEVLKIKL